MITAKLYQEFKEEELQKVKTDNPETLKKTEDILDHLILNPEFEEFLTLRAGKELI